MSSCHDPSEHIAELLMPIKPNPEEMKIFQQFHWFSLALGIYENVIENINQNMTSRCDEELCVMTTCAIFLWLTQMLIYTMKNISWLERFARFNLPAVSLDLQHRPSPDCAFVQSTSAPCPFWSPTRSFPSAITAERSSALNLTPIGFCWDWKEKEIASLNVRLQM